MEGTISRIPAFALKVTLIMHDYIGSVRFFKNLILLVVIVLIAVPTALSIRWKLALTSAETAIVQLEDQTAQLSSQLAQASEETLVPMDATPTASLGDGPAYQELYPDFYASDQPAEGTRTDNVIYLTFDDGPSARTPEILKILEEKDVKAAFFVVGTSDEQSYQWMRDIVAQGHTLGMHSYSHNYAKIYQSVEAYLEDMYKLFSLIREATGTTPSIFRLPGGSINGYNYGIYQEILAEMLRRGFVPYDWNLCNEDAVGSRQSAATLTANVINGAAKVNRGIVLMHDSQAKTTTVESLPSMIDQLREMGFQLDRLTADVKPILFSYVE